MKIGDLVQLKSGGPAMVLASLERNLLTGGQEGWLCFWSIQGAARREIFPEVVLQPYQPEAKD